MKRSSRHMSNALLAAVLAGILGMTPVGAEAKPGETTHLVIRRGDVVIRLDGRRMDDWVIRDVVRDIRRDIREAVIRDVVRDVRRKVIRVRPYGGLVILGNDRAELRESTLRLLERLLELEDRLESKGWQ